MDRATLTLLHSRRAAGPPVLPPAALLAAQSHGACILDVRPHDRFAAGHLPGAVNVGLGERFSRTCGALVPAGVEIVVVGNVESAASAYGRLTAAGLGPVVGVARPDRGWTGRSPRIRDVASPGPTQVVDVRDGAHPRPGIVRIPLDELLVRLVELRPDGPTVVLDDDGHASSAAASFLRACGFAQVTEMLGADVVRRPHLRLLASA